MKNILFIIIILIAQKSMAQEGNVLTVHQVIYAPLEYQSTLAKIKSNYHHLQDSINEIRRKHFEMDSNYKELKNVFVLNGKKYSGYDGGLVGYYMQECWTEGELIVKKFIDIDRVSGCGNGTIYMDDGKNLNYSYYHCLRRIPIPNKNESISQKYTSELIEIRFFDSINNLKMN